MNNNLVTERALRDVFETTSYINVGLQDNPLEYGLKPPIRSCENGKQFGTEVLKHGRIPSVLFQKEWPQVSDGDTFQDHSRYVDTQHERFKGFLDSDFSKRDEFSNTIRTEQYREQLKFDGPQFLYDINRSAVTPHCMRCHKDTYFCPHRAAYGTGNPHLDKEKGGLTTASEEIGRTAKQYSYAKPPFAKKPIIKDTFYRRQNIFFQPKTNTNFLNQALVT